MTLIKERVEELQKELRTLIRPGFLCLPIDEADALLSAYRTREAAIAECEAWRKMHTECPVGDDEFCFNESVRLQSIVDEARAATDAARREEVKGE